jgi:hypothetical protein
VVCCRFVALSFAHHVTGSVASPICLIAHHIQHFGQGWHRFQPFQDLRAIESLAFSQRDLFTKADLQTLMRASHHAEVYRRLSALKLF